MAEEPFEIAKDLNALALRIKSDLPLSASVFNSILMHARGHATDYTFFTLRQHPDTHVVMCLDTVSRNVAFHCRSEELRLLSESLAKSHVLEWDAFLLFFYVPEFMQEALQQVARARSGTELRRSDCITFVYDNEVDGEPMRCAAGLRVCRLGEEGIRHMLETSKFHKKIPPEKMRQFLASAASVGVYEAPNVESETEVDAKNLDVAGDDEKPLAWITALSYGSLGVLMTRESHRGRGLGSLVTQVAARVQADQGFVPVTYVETDNEPSLGMFRKLRGWKETGRATWMVHISPKSHGNKDKWT